LLHKRTYPRFWEWRNQLVEATMLDRKMETVYGWPLYISNSPNKKTLGNFPMQANGAEMLRLAAMRLCDVGIVPCMLVHDAVLIEADNEEQIAHAVEIMKSAGRDVCDGFEIGVDVEKMEQGKRYRDKREMAILMWKEMMRTLQEIGALPPGELP
jgi:DNA polymerase-1